MNLSPFLVHIGLMLISTMGTAMVIWGIVKESWKENRRIAAVIIFGTTLEVLCTLGLLLYDEGISHALEARLAARSLSVEDEASISRAISPYSGQSFEIHTYESDKEAADITDEIRSTLRNADWRDQNPPGDFGMATVVAGVSVRIDASAPQGTKSAARALVTTLNGHNIAATTRTLANTGAPQRLNITVGIKP